MEIVGGGILLIIVTGRVDAVGVRLPGRRIRSRNLSAVLVDTPPVPGGRMALQRDIVARGVALRHVNTAHR